MNKEKYLAQIKRKLWALNTETKEKIFADIAQSIQHFDGKDDEIISHFGTAKQLVQAYIQDMDYPLSIQAKICLYVSSFSKKVFFWLGLIFAIIIILIVMVINKYSSDRFNYADIQHEAWNIDNPNTTEKSVLWHEIVNPDNFTLSVYQAHVAIRFHDSSNVAVKCNRRRNNLPKINENNILQLERGYCLIYLPKAVKIDIRQSNVTIVRPIDGIYIKATESNVRIVEKDNGYDYRITKKQSDIDTITNNPNSDITITAELIRSALERYRY